MKSVFEFQDSKNYYLLTKFILSKYHELKGNGSLALKKYEFRLKRILTFAKFVEIKFLKDLLLRNDI